MAALRQKAVIRSGMAAARDSSGRFFHFLAPRHQHGGTVITKVPSDAGS
jgi:hypothetical protein